jgi:hypothetical protein
VKPILRFLFVMQAICFFPVRAAADPSPICDEAGATIESVAVDEAAAAATRTALSAHVQALPNAAWAPGYCRAVADNFARKLASRREGVSFDAEALIRTGLDYEAFRIAAFRNSGVAPKLYFGFLDGRGVTADYEKTLLRVSARAADLLNAYAEKNKIDVRVTAKEIAVTQMSEGGALLLTKNFANVNNVRPVGGVGLDDYRIGFPRFPGLAEEIDRVFGAHIAGMKGGIGVEIVGGDRMTFVETILGTAVMYLYEKDLAEQKLRADNRPSLRAAPLDEQFVVASLVYNSGILFADERAKQILAFDTAAYLRDISERSAPKRPRLPVLSAAEADAWLAEGKALPEQPTSWNAVYHVLQRYGAWVALARFSSAFAEDGSVRGAP